jgi:hypothetical protein
MPTVLTVDWIPMNGDFSSKSAVHVLNWVSRVDVGAGAIFIPITLRQETFFYRLDSVGSGFGIMDFLASSKVAQQDLESLWM